MPNGESKLETTNPTAKRRIQIQNGKSKIKKRRIAIRLLDSLFGFYIRCTFEFGFIVLNLDLRLSLSGHRSLLTTHSINHNRTGHIDSPATNGRGVARIFGGGGVPRGGGGGCRDPPKKLTSQTSVRLS